MHALRALLLAINVLGGAAVLGSYALGIRSHANAGAVLWGGVPEALRPLYTASMLSATVGYLAFTAFVFFRVEPDGARVGPFGYGAFLVLYLAILVPSALWMPLTFRFVDGGATAEGLWLAVRGVLALVGIGAAGMIAAVAMVEAPAAGLLFRAAAVAGAVAFSIQTTLLDGIIWPYFYRR